MPKKKKLSGKDKVRVKTKKASAAKKRPVKKTNQKEKLMTPKDLKRWKPGPHPIELILKSIIVLSLIGLMIAGYLIYMHFKPEASSICSINNKLDCDTVNKSDYAQFMGIPNSIIGALGYIYFIVMSLIILKGVNLSKIHKGLRAKHLNFLVILFSVIGWLFSMYLLYIEAFVLYTYCIFCLASLAIITAIMILSFFSWNHCMRCKKVINRIHYKAKGKMCRYC